MTRHRSTLAKKHITEEHLDVLLHIFIGWRQQPDLYKIQPSRNGSNIFGAMEICSKHGITKTCLFKNTENFTTKKWKFSYKNSDIFHISAQNIDYGLNEAVLTNTHNLCFEQK